jgi:cyclophilin family peptidyl-prolyl cis-trans isomerase
MGNIVCKLFDKDAPKTVENFVGLAEGTKEFKNKAPVRTKAQFLRWPGLSSRDSRLHDSGAAREATAAAVPATPSRTNFIPR